MDSISYQDQSYKHDKIKILYFLTNPIVLYFLGEATTKQHRIEYGLLLHSAFNLETSRILILSLICESLSSGL